MKIGFHGAARTVTGSKHLVTLENGFRLLLDCGMFQGLGVKTAELNENFGFDPTTVSILLLSHAHIDHSGLIPLLVKRGFQGKILCTQATRDLTEILLRDSAGIQINETIQANKMRSEHSLEAYEPLYDEQDVEVCLQQFETVEYNVPVKINDEVIAIFQNTGHLIGSASIHLSIIEAGEKTTILFSGDVGRYRSTLLQPPSEYEQVDYIIMESTYGNSSHPLNISTVDPLLEQIKATCIERKGKLIIPAFSVGRTQEVLYSLNQLELEHRLPELKYFVDSPLGAKATEVIKHYMEYFNDRLQSILQTDDDPFDFNGLRYVESSDESIELAAYKEPCVIISSSGTGDAGRVRHHIFSAIEDDKNCILFVGYCQDQSLGGRLLSGCKTVEIFGETCSVRAEIKQLGSMSAHGDSSDLFKFISGNDPNMVNNLFLVHGEYDIQKSFAEKLKVKGYNVYIPAMNEEYIIEKQPALSVK